MNNQTLKIGLAQIAPVWLSREKTIEKIKAFVSDAAADGCELVVFGEALLPGYPFWLTLTHGAEFNSTLQKEIHAHYVMNAIQIEAGQLDPICQMAKELHLAIFLGTIEKAMDRGGHSLYCSLVYIDNQGIIQSVHRKLQPTYEERLAWAQGDGHGLRVHPLKGFSVGGLNCWENWMPLTRSVLYGLGENLHIAVWPGSDHITNDITRFIAQESRSFVVSVSGLMRKQDFPDDTPHLDKILENAPQVLANGGSCLAAPDGKWIIEPVTDREGIFTETINLEEVFKERQNFDPAGHYARPDVTQLSVNRERQATIHIKDN